MPSRLIVLLLFLSGIAVPLSCSLGNSDLDIENVLQPVFKRFDVFDFSVSIVNLRAATTCDLTVLIVILETLDDHPVVKLRLDE
jgi:hypothetical protein